MSMRRRRYQSLGLMKKSRNRHDCGGPLEGIEKFVSESHVNDLILYNRVTRARPEIRQLEFANDDVDWWLEYLCGAIGKWLRRLLAWLLGILESLMRFLGFRRKDCDDDNGENGDDRSEGGREDDRRRRNKMMMIFEPDCLNGTNKFEQANNRIAHTYPEILWRFENCIPYLNRRIVKRKWLLNPKTREWAEARIELFRKHVKRGFRTLCSGVGMDTKIYVVCSSKDVEAEKPMSSSSSEPKFVSFRADSNMLTLHSSIFCDWFLLSGDDKQVATAFVTPQEMQAILVYIYTLTWPTDVTIRKKGKKVASLSPRFLQILKAYGISLKLAREIPPIEQRRSKLLSLSEKEESPEKDENQNVEILNEVTNNLLSSPVSSSNPNFIAPIASNPEGQGDCSPCFKDAGTFQCMNEMELYQDTSIKEVSLTSPSSPPQSPSSVTGKSSNSHDEDNRSLNASKFVKTKVKDSLRISFPSKHRRIYPETILTMSDHRSRLKIHDPNPTKAIVSFSIDAENKNYDGG